MNQEILPITFQVIYKGTVKYRVKGKRLEFLEMYYCMLTNQTQKNYGPLKLEPTSCRSVMYFPLKTQFLVRKLGEQL